MFHLFSKGTEHAVEQVASKTHVRRIYLLIRQSLETARIPGKAFPETVVSKCRNYDNGITVTNTPARSKPACGAHGQRLLRNWARCTADRKLSVFTSFTPATNVMHSQSLLNSRSRPVDKDPVNTRECCKSWDLQVGGENELSSAMALAPNTSRACVLSSWISDFPCCEIARTGRPSNLTNYRCVCMCVSVFICVEDAFQLKLDPPISNVFLELSQWW